MMSEPPLAALAFCALHNTSLTFLRGGFDVLLGQHAAMPFRSSIIFQYCFLN